MLKYLLITRKSKFNDTDRIEVECRVILVNVLMPCDAFKEAYTHSAHTQIETIIGTSKMFA